MLNNELITLLRNLNLSEFKKLENFICSPYFNLSNKIVELYNILENYYPSFSSPDLTVNKLAETLGYSGKNSDASVRNLMSRLAKYVRKFLIYEEIEKDPVNMDVYALKSFSGKKMEQQFYSTAASISESLKAGNDPRDNYYKYILGIERYNFAILNNKITKSQALTEETDNLNASGLNFIFFAISELMTFYLNLEAYKNEFTFTDEINIYKDILKRIDLEKLTKEIKNHDWPKHTLALYSKLFLAYSNPGNENHYFSFKEELVKNSHLLSSDDKTFYYSKLVNYCITKIVSVDMLFDFNKELFEVNREILDNKYYLNSKVDHLPYDLFRDVIMHALKLNKSDWVESFINLYGKELQGSHRTDLVNFAYANLYYSTGSNDKAFDHINKIHDDYFIFKYDLKNLKLKIFYDGAYYESAFSLVHSYRQFLRTNTMVSNSRRERYRNFVNCYEKLLLFKTGKKKIDLEYIKYKLQQINDTAFTAWLIERLENNLDGKGSSGKTGITQIKKVMLSKNKTKQSK